MKATKYILQCPEIGDVSCNGKECQECVGMLEKLNGIIHVYEIDESKANMTAIVINKRKTMKAKRYA